MYGIRQCNRKKKFRWDWCILYWNIFLNFSCDIELKIYTTKYSNLLLIILILFELFAAHTEKEKFWCKSDMSPANLFTVTCHTKWSRSVSHLHYTTVHSMWSILCTRTRFNGTNGRVHFVTYFHVISLLQTFLPCFQFHAFSNICNQTGWSIYMISPIWYYLFFRSIAFQMYTNYEKLFG